MTYAYLSVAKFKDALGISQTERDYDAELLGLSEQVADAFEQLTQRSFHAVNGIRLYDGNRAFRGRDGYVRLLLGGNDDLISVTSVMFDENFDSIYELTLATSDYWLDPANKYPKRRIVLNPMGKRAIFPSAPRSIQIAGLFGYSNEVQRLTAVLGADLTDTTGTTLTLTAGHIDKGDLVGPGDTLLIDSEQVYVVAKLDEATVTIKRGINGTTAAIHPLGTAIDRRVFPASFILGLSMQLARFRRELQAGASGAQGDPGLGFTFNNLYPAIMELARPFVFMEVR